MNRRMHYILLALLLLSLTGHFFDMRIIRVQRNIIDLLEATAKKQTAALADLNARCLGGTMEPVTPAIAYDKAPNDRWINCLTLDAKGAPVPCKPSGWRFIGDPPSWNSKTLAEWCSPENMETFYKENPNAGNGGDSPFRDCLLPQVTDVQHKGK